MMGFIFIAILFEAIINASFPTPSGFFSAEHDLIKNGNPDLFQA